MSSRIVPPGATGYTGARTVTVAQVRSRSGELTAGAAEAGLVRT